MITESPRLALSIGIDVQPIIDHGRSGWRIFKPDGSYVCQFTPEAAARTAIRWSNQQADIRKISEEIAHSNISDHFYLPAKK